jgi:hypothetical protein
VDSELARGPVSMDLHRRSIDLSALGIEWASRQVLMILILSSHKPNSCFIYERYGVEWTPWTSSDPSKP